MERDDLPKNNPKIPDPYHGFVYAAKDLPKSLLKGIQKLVLFGSVGANGTKHQFGFKRGQTIKKCLCDGAECPCPSEIARP